MIFPVQCKEVGYASTKPCGDRVYFLSRYLVRDTGAGTEVLEITPDPAGSGMMRTIVASKVIGLPAKPVTTRKRCRSMIAPDLSGLHLIQVTAAQSLPGLTNT